MTDLSERLNLLTDSARFDACDTFAQGGRRYTPKHATWDQQGVAAESGPDGKSRPVFRVLMSSRCAWNCAYCPLRADNDTPRAALQPEELAKSFLPRHEHGVVQGLMLSTGVDGDRDQAMNRMLDAVEFLRTRHEYKGYVHVKLLPGATPGTIERAALLAERISLNLEAPSPEHLAKISPERDWYADLIAPLLLAREWQRRRIERAAPHRKADPRATHLPSGLATQFVVGAAGESDRELLLTTSWLYRDLELRRVYYGAFRPVPGTPLEQQAATPFIRARRLHEADWLLRNYGFQASELPYREADRLPLHIDPKLAWALANPERFPVEINTADPETLLRVPGLGPLSVRRIVRLRREYRFSAPEHLAALGTAAVRARDFLTLSGRFFGVSAAERARRDAIAAQMPVVEQLSLWE